MAQPELRPFGVGEMLDAAIKIYRDRFTTLITVTAVVVVPLGILQAMLTAQILSDPADLGAGLASLVLAVVGVVVTQVATAAVTLAIADAYLDNEAPWQSYLAAAFSRTGAVVGASLLFGLAVLVGFLGLIVGAVVIGAGLGVFMPALMVERLGATQSLRRAWNLSNGHKWRIFGTWLVAYIIVVVVSVIVGTVFAFGITTTSVVADQLLAVAASVLTTPFMASVVVVIYFDLRVRKEGFDLEMLSGQIAGPLPPTGFDDPDNPWASPIE